MHPWSVYIAAGGWRGALPEHRLVAIAWKACFEASQITETTREILSEIYSSSFTEEHGSGSAFEIWLLCWDLLGISYEDIGGSRTRIWRFAVAGRMFDTIHISAFIASSIREISTLPTVSWYIQDLCKNSFYTVDAHDHCQDWNLPFLVSEHSLGARVRDSNSTESLKPV